MDKFLVFSLSLEDQAFLKSYCAPAGERSILKYVPVNQVERARVILKKIGIWTRTKYRGPRYDCGKYTTLKRHALHAALYRI